MDEAGRRGEMASAGDTTRIVGINDGSMAGAAWETDRVSGAAGISPRSRNMFSCSCGRKGATNMSYAGPGQGEFVKEINYHYVGAGAGEFADMSTVRTPHTCLRVSLLAAAAAGLLVLIAVLVVGTRAQSTTSVKLRAAVGFDCGSQVPPNATPPAADDAVRWSDDKSEWCCRNTGTGCPVCSTEARGCDAMCLDGGLGSSASNFSCRARTSWVQNTSHLTWRDAVKSVNKECLCQCACMVDDFEG